MPKRRGAYDFRGPAGISAFPFGLFNSLRWTNSPARVLVYPHFRKLKLIDIPVGRKHQPGGLQMASHIGDSEEFIGNREYRPGDRLRDIDYKAWARNGEPVVREFQQEYLCRIALVVDTFTKNDIHKNSAKSVLEKIPLLVSSKKRKPENKTLEAAISIGAAVADALNRQEYIVDIFAAGPELYHFQAGRSLAYLDNILDVLACIEECDEDPFKTIAPAIMEDIEKISSAVVIMLDWDETRRKFVQMMQECGVAIKLIVIKDTRPELDIETLATEGGRATWLTPRQVEKGIESL